MTLALPLNEDQRDCLQELTNIAMGAAAESLAEFTNLFVCLPIPVIRCVDAITLLTSFDHIDKDKPASILSQQCKVGHMDCGILFIISDESVQDVADSTGYDTTSDLADSELVLKLFDTISVTCFDRMGEIFETDISRQEAVIKARHVLPETIDLSTETDNQSLIAVEINYHIESHPFSCNLLLLFPEKILPQLVDSLDGLLN
jgi:chemotaxis protein CheC